MAGDIGIEEQAIVVGTAGGAAMAAAAVVEAKGRVRHEYGSSVLIGEVPPGAEDRVRQAVGDGTFGLDGAQLMGSGVDEVGALGLAAFDLRQSEEYMEAKSNRPRAGENWDTDESSAPDVLDIEGKGALQADVGAPTSSRLMGRVAVGLIIVEGPTADLKFSAAERTKVVAEVQNGLGWLGAQSSPAGVTWVYDIRIVTLTVKPGPANAEPGVKEALWRDPAMKQLGFGSGMAGVSAYVERLRTSLKTDWSYCAYFTKYPIYHFAYASLGGPRLVMAYANDGWGPDNIDRVFAHETGHIFNAPDEYKAANCDCGGQWGFFKQPNANCETCASGGGVPCIMKSNDWAMCQYTPYHLGFPQGQRYTGVFEGGTGAYGLWVNADWNHFVAKWNEWNAQGLRLEDIEISGNGTRFSGVFRAGTGAYGLWGGADWNGFVAKWKEWSAQGLRLVDVAIAGSGAGARYTGVYKAGTGAFGLWGNADWNGFVAKWKEWSAQGLRLVDIEMVGSGAGARYTGVYRAGTGAYGLWGNADWNSFHAKWKEWSAQGLRLIDLEISGSGADTRYTGVFGPGTGPYGLWVNADWQSFQTKWKEWSGQGFRLTDFIVTGTGIESAASPTPVGAIAASEAGGAEGFGMVFLGTESTADDGSGGAGFGGSSLETGSGQGGASMLGGAGIAPDAEDAGDGAAGYGASSLPGDTAAAEGAGQGAASLEGASAGAANGAGNGAGANAGYGFSSLTGSGSGSAWPE